MVAKKLIQNKSKEEEEYNSDSESEITYDYDDDDDDDDSSDEPDMEDSENEERETSQTPQSKKRKSPKLVRFAEPPDEDDDNDSNDVGDEGENEEDDDDDDNGSNKLEQPKKKKRKLLLNPANAEDSDDDDEEGSDDDNDGDDEEEEEEKKEAEEGEEEKAQSGFANVLSNILGKKTVSSKKVILARGKTDREIRKLKESKLPPEERDSTQILSAQELEEKKLKRKLWLEMAKKKPKPLEKHYEKELKMIATRGVVQLFNAVKKQQKMMNENLSGTSTERRKDMIIESMNKKSFISLLQNTKVDVSIKSTEKETIPAKEPERKMWSVLKDDFVIGTGNMKDWDKQQDTDML